jgi:tight adherence protein B
MRRSRSLLLALAISVGVGAAPARAQAPVDELEVMLAVDTSGSMWPAIREAKAAANEFIAAMPADVRIGVATFGSDVAVLSGPTTDRALLTEQINGIVPGGNTALYDAVVAASQQFTEDVEHKVLVLLSDGHDDGSVASLDVAVAAVQGEHVEAISLTTPESDPASLAALGTVTPAGDPAGMSAAFGRVADLLITEVVDTTVPPTTAAPSTTATPPSTAPATTHPATTTPVTSATVVAAAPPVPAAPPTTTSPDASAEPARSARALWLGTAAIFAALFTLVLLCWPRQRVSKARLGVGSPRSVADMGRRSTSAVDALLERHGKRSDLAVTLSVANISMAPADFVILVGVGAVVAGLLGLLIGGPIVGALLAAVVCLGVRMYVRRATSRRQTAFADQLPDVLQLLTTTLRSGHGLTQALESVAEEAEEPARSEFAHALVESRLGRDLTDALRALARRMGSKDLEWVVSAIDINRDTGGNLSEVLATVGATIRERQRMARHVRTLTAEGRLSARILTALPVLMLLWQWRVNPANFALLTHGAGLVALFVACIILVIGTVWVRKTVDSIAL